MSLAKSPTLAAVLSFVVPGLGQVSLGSVRRGILISLPAIGIFVAAVGLRLAGGGAVLGFLVRPEVLVGLLILNVALAGYHALAVIDAYGAAVAGHPGHGPARRLSVAVLTAVLLATVSLHGAIEAVGFQAYETSEGIFVPSGPGEGWSIPDPGFDPEATPTATSSPSSSPGNSPSPVVSPSVVVTPSPVVTTSPVVTPSPVVTTSPSPSATPGWARDGRLNLLLIGSDAGPDRWSLRTDTIIVLSVDVDTGRIALFGIPRNLVGVPLPPESAAAFSNGRFPGLLNALYVYAMGHPRDFPGGDARGFRAVTGAVQQLVGVRLDGVIVVDLKGFVELVDALGGLWIYIPERLVDQNYPLEDGSGHIQLDFRVGCQHLNGRMALAYARSRHQDSDYGRMARQQQVLVALAHQLDPIALLPKVPRLLKVAADNLWTTVPRSEVANLAELAARADTGHVKTMQFVPSRYPSHLDAPEIARIQHVVRSVFDDASSAGSWSPGRSWKACP